MLKLLKNYDPESYGKTLLLTGFPSLYSGIYYSNKTEVNINKPRKEYKNENHQEEQPEPF